MMNHLLQSTPAARELSSARKVLLAAVGFAAVAAPVLVGIWNAPPAKAQSLREEKLSFEVASVKPSNGNEFVFEFSPQGRLTARGVPLMILVASAYDIPFQSERLSGLPADAANATYDIEATAVGALPATASKRVREAKMRLMLQNLLADRFQMKVRRETKTVPVYAIVVGKNGPKLKKSKMEEMDCPEGGTGPGQCHQFMGGMGRGLHAQAISMGDLAMAVSNWADKPVIDRTGLDGLYEIETEGWTPMRAMGPDGNEAESRTLTDPTRPTLFMILDRLGLKLESSKAEMDMYVVEHVEKPTAN